MNGFLKSRIEKLISVNDIIKREFKWSSDVYTRSFAALVYGMSDKEFDLDELKGLQQFMKNNTGVFSHYRSHEKFTIPALLITKLENPRVGFEYVLSYENRLKNAGFTKGPMLAIASYALLLTCNEEMVDIRINKAREIYKRMREKHYWLTGHDDYPLSVLISASEKDSHSIMEEIENYYSMLNKEGLSKSNGLQQLSHILTFSSERAENKVKKCMDVFRFFKDNKIGFYSRDYGVLGLIALAGGNDEMLWEVSEVYSYLLDESTFKWVTKEIKLLMACSLVCDKYIKNIKENNGILEASIGISIEALIAAQNAAIIATITSTSAAAASSST